MKKLSLIFAAFPFFAMGDSKTAVEKKFPGQSIVASCSGEFLGRKGEEAMVVLDHKAKLHRILWVKPDGDVAIVDTVPKTSEEKFELQCMNPKQATNHRQAAESSEGIHTFLKFSKGQGILCYFTDDVNAKCWTFDRKKNALVEAGGWQT